MLHHSLDNTRKAKNITSQAQLKVAAGSSKPKELQLTQILKKVPWTQPEAPTGFLIGVTDTTYISYKSYQLVLATETAETRKFHISSKG
jgi:hypothetical protein